MGQTIERTVTLTGREEMLTRLIAVDDKSVVREKFRELVLQHAGRTKTSEDVVWLLVKAIQDSSEGLVPAIAMMMYVDLYGYINAIVGAGHGDFKAAARIFYNKKFK